MTDETVGIHEFASAGLLIGVLMVLRVMTSRCKLITTSATGSGNGSSINSSGRARS